MITIKNEAIKDNNDYHEIPFVSIGLWGQVKRGREGDYRVE